MKRKPRFKWHKMSSTHYLATFGQSKLTASVQKFLGTSFWKVSSVFGRRPNQMDKFLQPEHAMLEAERLAKKYTRQLVNFWTT